MSWLTNLVKSALSYIGAFFAGFTYATIREQKKEAIEEKEYAEKQAQKWADAGTLSTSERLRLQARRKRRSKLLP